MLTTIKNITMNFRGVAAKAVNGGIMYVSKYNLR